jgi:hypothetical protein
LAINAKGGESILPKAKGPPKQKDSTTTILKILVYFSNWYLSKISISISN